MYCIDGQSAKINTAMAAGVVGIDPIPITSSTSTGYLSENFVALGEASVHVLLLRRRWHDVIGLKQSSSGVHQLQRVVVWRSNQASL